MMCRAKDQHKGHKIGNRSCGWIAGFKLGVLGRGHGNAGNDQFTFAGKFTLAGSEHRRIS